MKLSMCITHVKCYLCLQTTLISLETEEFPRTMEQAGAVNEAFGEWDEGCKDFFGERHQFQFLSRWWFQSFVIFSPTWINDPI